MTRCIRCGSANVFPDLDGMSCVTCGQVMFDAPKPRFSEPIPLYEQIGLDAAAPVTEKPRRVYPGQRKIPERAELYELWVVQGLSVEEIKVLKNRSTATVRHWIRWHKLEEVRALPDRAPAVRRVLEVRKTVNGVATVAIYDPATRPTRDELYEMYVVQKMSSYAIGRQAEPPRATSTVDSWLKADGLTGLRPVRRPGQNGEHSPFRTRTATLARKEA